MYTTLIATEPAAPFLGECLESVFRQTLPSAQVLVIVDVDADEPVGWASDLARSFPRVELLRNPQRGMVTAINYGLARTKTSLVAFLDSDDLWLPEKQARQVSRLEEAVELDAVTCLATNFRTGPNGDSVDLRASPSAMFTCTTFRRSTFARFGALDPTASHFIWLYRWWSRAKALGISTHHIDYLGVRRRLHSSNSWTAQGPVAHRALFAELRRIEEARRQDA